MYPQFFNTRNAAEKFIANTDESLTLYIRDGDGWIEYEHQTHKPGTPPDTSLHLGDERRAWLQEQGGIQPTIIRLIDEERKNEMFSVYDASASLGTPSPDYRVEESDYPVTWQVVQSGFETRRAAWDWVKENAKE